MYISRHCIPLFLCGLVWLGGACQPLPTPDVTMEVASQPTPSAVVVEMPSATADAQGDSIMIAPDILLDPALATDADSRMVAGYLYEGLVRLDDADRPLPALAVSWVASADQLTYSFTLRPDAVFSDGAPITADVVIANFRRWFDPGDLRHQGDFASWRRVFFGFLGESEVGGRPRTFFDGLEKTGPNTLIMHLNRPWPALPQNLADPAFAILKPDALGDGSYGKIGSTIISSGPYTVFAWTSQRLALIPNHRYWGTPAQGILHFTWP